MNKLYAMHTKEGEMKKLLQSGKIKMAMLIFVGSFLMALAINIVYDPKGLVTGGVTGLAIIIKYGLDDLFHVSIPVWLTNLVLNVPLFVVAFFTKGKKYILRTGAATLLLSAWIYIIPIVDCFTDYFQASIVGATLSGLGIGMILAGGATTGGTDLFCDLLHLKLKAYSVPMLLAFVDGSIVIAGIFYYGIGNGVYAIAIVFFISMISNSLLEGLKFAKMAMIISDKNDEIARVLMTDLDRGATMVNGTGMYSGEERKVLYCAVGKKQIVQLIEIVKKIDPMAFVVVSDVREVMGEGFSRK